MRMCALGASRQTAHEEIRVLSNEAGSVVKNEVSYRRRSPTMSSLL